ncbi:hypothetical protein MMC13_004317 [Lambiella insularis]|nr:hypothetical protein [Lambiella insularis]
MKVPASVVQTTSDSLTFAPVQSPGAAPVQQDTSPAQTSPSTSTPPTAGTTSSVFVNPPATPKPTPQAPQAQSSPKSDFYRYVGYRNRPTRWASRRAIQGQNSASPSSVVVNNVPVQIAPSKVVIGTQTVVPSVVTTPVVVNGQTFAIYPSQVVGPGGPVLAIPSSANPSAEFATAVVTLGNQAITQLSPSVFQLAGTTLTLPPKAQSSTVSIDGKQYTIYPSSIVAGGSSVVLPTISPSFEAAAATTTIAGIPIVLSPSSIIIGSSTYTFSPNQAPITTTISNQPITIGPSGIIFPSTTLCLATLTTPPPAPVLSAITADGLTFDIGVTEAIISSTTIQLGAGATSATLTIGGQTITVNSNGLILPSTTIAPLQSPTFSAVTADGLVMSIESGEIYISGTDYAIGHGATPTTFVVTGQTVVVGSAGVVVGKTTIAAPTETGGSTSAGGSGSSGSSLGTGGRSAEMDRRIWGITLGAFVGGVVMI